MCTFCKENLEKWGLKKEILIDAGSGHPRYEICCCGSIYIIKFGLCPSPLKYPNPPALKLLDSKGYLKLADLIHKFFIKNSNR